MRSDMKFRTATRGSRPHRMALPCGVREIDDPNSGTRWLLVRDKTNPGGPGRLELVIAGEGSWRSRNAGSNPIGRTNQAHTDHPTGGQTGRRRTLGDNRRLSRGGSPWARRTGLCFGRPPVDRAQRGAGRGGGARTGGAQSRRRGEAMRTRGKRAVWLMVGLALGAFPAHGGWRKGKPADAVNTPPEAALHSYVERVRAQQAAEIRTPGSIWSSEGRLVRLGTDAKAVRLHDVVSVVVTESLAASTDGQVKNSRASNASSNVTALFGALKASNALQNLVGQTSASGLTAQGQSTTNSSLVTTFGAEVVDVLPNGMLVVQATRQLTFSQQTQLIKLRGPGAARRRERPEPGVVDGHDRSGTGSDGQGYRHRLNLPAESAGAAAATAADFLDTRTGDQGTGNRNETGRCDCWLQGEKWERAGR